MWPLVWSGFPYKHGELGSRGESWEREMERRRKGERGGRELVETTWTLWTWKSHSVTSTTFYWSKQLQSPLGFGRQGHRLHNSVVECRIVRGHIKWDVYWYSHLWTIHSMQEGWASVQFGCSVVSDSWRPHGLQHTRLPCPSPRTGAYLNSRPSCRWCHPAISSSSSSCPPAFTLSQHQGLFQWVGSLHQEAKLLEFQLQHQSCQWIFRINFL